MEITKGLVFSQLTILHRDARITRDGGSYWKCRCDGCKRSISVKDTNLLAKKIISCKPNGGTCNLALPTLTGNKYGDFLVGEVDTKKRINGKIYYHVSCVRCGEHYSKRGSSLVAGESSKCKACTLPSVY